MVKHGSLQSDKGRVILTFPFNERENYTWV